MKKLIKNISKKIISFFVRVFRRRKETIIKAAQYVIDEANHIPGKRKPAPKKLARPPVEKLCLELAQFDIISFDIFDTLVLRAFPDPKVIFDLWGCQFGLQYGRKMRAEAEKECRKQNGDMEVTLDEIYERVSKASGIDKGIGMQAEIDLELRFCRPNPFFQKVFSRLIQMGKQVIVVSDMYLPKSVIEAMLKKCGYRGYEALYVSCDSGKSKVSGELFRFVTDIYGSQKSYVHIGDNKKSDVENARKCGWTPYFYMNVNQVGKPFRPDGMSSLGGGLYRGIVNAKLYSGAEKLDPYYELGFVHFGILAYGYCQWLNQLARERGADLILFAARDMHVVHRVYNEWFGDVPNEYIPVSRLASIRADFNHCTEMFLTCLQDAGSKTILEYLTSIQFDFLAPLLEKYEIPQQELIKNLDVSLLKSFVLENKEEILQHLEADHTAAIQFYSNIIGKHGKIHTVLFADMNGRCTSGCAMQQLLRDAGFDIRVINAQVYSISNKGFVEIKITDGTLDTYIFSYLKNRNLYDRFRKNGIKRTKVIESVFTEPIGTLHSYVEGPDGQMRYGPAESDQEKLASIHQGIMDFVRTYHQYAVMIDEDFTLSPFDAWMPAEQVIDRIPKKFPELLNDMTLGH